MTNPAVKNNVVPRLFVGAFMRHLLSISPVMLTTLIVGCQRDKTTTLHSAALADTALSKPTKPNQNPPALAKAEEPYAPQEVAWQDIRLGMTEEEYLKCIRTKIFEEPRKSWVNDGSIKTIDGKLKYIRIDFHDHDGKQDRTLDNSIPSMFGELPSHRTFLTDDSVSHLDYLETCDTPNKNSLIKMVEATFVNNRLIVLHLQIKSSIVPIEEAQKKFEQKYQGRFEAMQIMTYRMPDIIIKSAINCLVLKKNRCSICLNEGSTEFPSSGYYIQIQDDFRLKELQEKSKVKIAELQQKAKAASKAKSDTVKF